MARKRGKSYTYDPSTGRVVRRTADQPKPRPRPKPPTRTRTIGSGEIPAGRTRGREVVSLKTYKGKPRKTIGPEKPERESTLGRIGRGIAREAFEPVAEAIFGGAYGGRPSGGLRPRSPGRRVEAAAAGGRQAVHLGSALTLGPDLSKALERAATGKAALPSGRGAKLGLAADVAMAPFIFGKPLRAGRALAAASIAGRESQGPARRAVIENAFDAAMSGPTLTRAIITKAKGAAVLRSPERAYVHDLVDKVIPDKVAARVTKERFDAHVLLATRGERSQKQAAREAYATLRESVFNDIPEARGVSEGYAIVREAKPPVEPLNPTHKELLASRESARKAYEEARQATKGKGKTHPSHKALAKAKGQLDEAKNAELYARVEAQEAVKPLTSKDPRYKARQATAERLIEDYGGRRGGLPPNMRSAKDIQRVLSLLDSLATRGEAGRLWYEDSAKAILSAARGNKERAAKIAQLFAIYSPQQPILGNTSLAFRAYNEFLTNGKITTGQNWQQRAAERVLRGEGDWEGRKTNNFYLNFLEDIDPERYAQERILSEDEIKKAIADGKMFEGQTDLGEVTADLWMARAFGYTTDKVSEGRYDVIESLTRLLAEERGWKPKQMQAAIWTAIKDASDDVSANIDFATGVDRHLAQINYEAAIGSGDPALRAAYESWPSDVQQAFLRAKARLVDGFVDEVGLLSSHSNYGPGVWADEANPGAQLKIGTSAAPRGGPGRSKVSYRLAKNERNLLDATSAAISRGLKQDAVAWVRPFKPLSKGAQDTLKVRLGRQATEQEGADLWWRLNPGGPEDERFLVTHTDDGLLVRNISSTPNIAKKGFEFHSHATRSVDMVFPDKPPVIGYASDGNLVFGENYDEHFARAFRNRRGSGEGLRFGEAADRLAREAERVDAAFVADPEGAARAAGSYRGEGLPPSVEEIAAAPTGRLGALREAAGEMFSPKLGIVPPHMRPRDLYPRNFGSIADDPLRPVERESLMAEYQALAEREALTDEERQHLADLADVLGMRHGVPIGAPIQQAEEIVDPLAHAQKVLRQGAQGAKGTYARQEALRSQARSARARAAEEALQAGEGQSAFAAAGEEMRGELPALNFKGFDKLDQDGLEALYNHIRTHPNLQTFEKYRAYKSLTNALAGKVPTPSEVKLFERAFGKQVAQNIKVASSWAEKAKHAGLEIWNLPRSLMSSLDLSAPFRQGLMTAPRYPRIFGQNMGQMVKAFGSQRVYEDIMGEILERPNFGLYEQAKVAFTDLSADLSKREEAFMSGIADRFPGVRHSSRAYIGFLNKMRADVFDFLIERARQDGVDVYDEKFLQSLGRYVNSATGRGDLGALNAHTATLAAALWSPRLLWSRLNFLNPVYYARLDPWVRREALKAAIQLGSSVAFVLFLANKAGASVEVDPRSANFAKIRVGDTRVDILGGFQQPIRLVSQLYSGKIISSTTGETLALGSEYGDLSRMDVLQRFIRSKANPSASLVWDMLEGTDFEGKPFDVKKAVVQRMVPLLAMDTWQVWREQDNLKKGLFLYGLGMWGFGTQVYGEKDPAPSSRPSRPSGYGGSYGGSYGGGSYGGSYGG